MFHPLMFRARSTVWEKGLATRVLLMTSFVCGLLWAWAIFRLVKAEVASCLLRALIALAAFQPACLVGGIYEILKYESNTTNQESRWCRPSVLAIWWTPVLLLAFVAVLLRLLLLAQLFIVVREFGTGLADWDGPEGASAISTGLFANLSDEQRKACDIMCRGSALLTWHSAHRPGAQPRTRNLFILLTQNGSMLRWSWQGYLLLEEVSRPSYPCRDPSWIVPRSYVDRAKITRGSCRGLSPHARGDVCHRAGVRLAPSPERRMRRRAARLLTLLRPRL